MSSTLCMMSTSMSAKGVQNQNGAVNKENCDSRIRTGQSINRENCDSRIKMGQSTERTAIPESEWGNQQRQQRFQNQNGKSTQTHKELRFQHRLTENCDSRIRGGTGGREGRLDWNVYCYYYYYYYFYYTTATATATATATTAQDRHRLHRRKENEGIINVNAD